MRKEIKRSRATAAQAVKACKFAEMAFCAGESHFISEENENKSNCNHKREHADAHSVKQQVFAVHFSVILFFAVLT